MKTKVQLRFTCSENWDAMSPRENGRHCAVCRKQVQDFTRATDAEILSYFRSHKNACGRFTSEQVINTPRWNAQNVRNWRLLPYAATVSSLLVVPLQFTSAQVFMGDTISIHDAKSREENRQSCRVRVHVVDSVNRLPVAQVRVSMLSDGKAPLDFHTDPTGNIVASFPYTPGLKISVLLEYNKLKYELRDISLHKADTTIQMQVAPESEEISTFSYSVMGRMETIIIESGIQAVEMPEPKQISAEVCEEWVQEVPEDRIQQATIEVFPNPSPGIFRFNSAETHENATYQVQNMQGQTIREGIWNANLPIDLTAHPAGTYIIRCTSGNRLIFEEKLVIQR